MSKLYINPDNIRYRPETEEFIKELRKADNPNIDNFVYYFKIGLNYLAMVMPFIIFAVICYYIYCLIKKKKENKTQ